jgi:hypothetical protein
MSENRKKRTYISDCAVKALLAVKSCVEQLARKYAIDSQALPN